MGFPPPQIKSSIGEVCSKALKLGSHLCALVVWARSTTSVSPATHTDTIEGLSCAGAGDTQPRSPPGARVAGVVLAW